MRAALAFQTSRHLPGDEKVAQAILHRHLWVSAKFAVQASQRQYKKKKPTRTLPLPPKQFYKIECL